MADKHPVCGAKSILVVHPSGQVQLNQPEEDFWLDN